MINNCCPYCETSLDGELIIDTFIEQGKDYNTALKYAKSYVGWEQHGLANRWNRLISIYCVYKDKTIMFKCPDCEKEWVRE